MGEFVEVGKGRRSGGSSPCILVSSPLRGGKTRDMPEMGASLAMMLEGMK